MEPFEKRLQVLEKQLAGVQKGLEDHAKEKNALEKIIEKLDNKVKVNQNVMGTQMEREYSHLVSVTKLTIFFK